MILTNRGEPVDSSRRAKIGKTRTPDHVRQRVQQLTAREQVRLNRVFNDDDVHRLCDELGIEFRDRCFTPATTLGLFVAQVLSRGDACSTVVARLNRERKRDGLPPMCEDASAYCKARSKLTVKLIDTLSKRVMQIARDKTPAPWKWKGRNVYLVDGLVLRAPDTDANQAVYPQPSSQEPGLGFPQVRVIFTVSLATGCILHYNTGPVEGKRTGELTLFRGKYDDFEPGDILLGDANFESFRDAVLLEQRGVNIVYCINASRKKPFEHPVNETIDDVIMEMKKPRFDGNRFTKEQWESLPETIRYRAIRYRVSGRQDEITIVTTLLDRDKFPAREIADLYGLRWDVEVDIRSYKSSMGMCDLRCQTPENLDREIAVAVLGYNLVRLLMNDTAAVLELHPREISFSHARDVWLTFHDEHETTADLTWMILSTSSHLVRDRPGREEPRAIKRRQTTKYPVLQVPRPSRARQIGTRSNEPPRN